MSELRWDHYKYFAFDEFDYPNKISETLMEKLEKAREFADTPFIITSDYRPDDKKAHGRGNAVDLSCTQSNKRMMIVRGLLHAGFDRIGIYNRHIHADIDTELPAGVMWWAQSK